MLQTGDTLAGYRIESVAGVGGMGVVYRATQLSLDRPVALKVLSSTLVGNRTFRERFRREGRHAAALDHPNIIPVYEAGESNGLMFIAMRLVDGPSLADLIGGDAVSGREALRIIAAIASALDAAHEAGLVHRDIKPQNILLTRTGHPYLADFGITKGTGHGGLTHNGDFVGSLNYVAPEQIEGKDVTGASDIYSLAAVLFQCLSGTYPYDRDSDAALIHAHLQAPPPTLIERGINAPARLDRVLETGMAKAPEERHKTASALVDGCVDALAGLDGAALDAAPAFPSPVVVEHAAARTSRTEPDRLSSAPPLEEPMTLRPATAVAPADLTATEKARPLPPTVPEPAPRRGFKPAHAAIVAATLLVAAPVLGYVLGHEDPPQRPATAASAALTLHHDATWSRSSGAIEGLTLEQPLTLRSVDGVKLTAGRLSSYAAGFDPVPKALRRRFANASTPVSIKLGSYAAARHAVTLSTGERLWLALAPDSKGWTVVACEGPAADRRTACPAIASTLDIRAARGVALGPDKRVSEQINAALAQLGAARASAGAGLRARRLRDRARAARAAAQAYAKAAQQLAALKLRPQERPLVTRLADALRAQGRDLERLAAAAAKRRVTSYDRARAAIGTHETRVQGALRRLGRIGYRTG